ncbi:MAG: EAL domain-containing protein [Xenococcaceae cyanobacterium]
MVKLLRKIRSLLSPAKDYYAHRSLLFRWIECFWCDRWSNLTSSPGAYAPSVFLASILVTFLLLGARQFGGLQFLELAAFDQMIRWQSDEIPDLRLLIVEITESDIQAQKRWPLSDGVIAQLLKKLQQYQPKVIGLDLYRDIPHPPGHNALLEQLQADNVIVMTKLGDRNRVPPPPGVPEERIGFSDFVIDADNVLRRNLIYAQSESGSRKVYSFCLQVSLRYLADYNMTFEVKPDSFQIGKTVFVRLQDNSGGYQMVPSEAAGWQVLLNYRSQNVARQVTLTEALNGEIDPSWVKDKVVLIGTTAPSAKDLFATPYSGAETENYLMPGVIVHAQMVSQILSTVLDNRPQFWFWAQGDEFLWIWGWSLVGGILVWRLHHPLSLGLAVAIAIGGLWGTCWLLFTQAGWVPFVPPVLALFATSVSVLAYKVLYRTYHDPLTDLPNRALFTKQLKWANNRKKQHQHSLIAVLFLDLNRFKIINESLGNRAGDQLLITIAERLKACLHPNEQLARFGGDEFVILLPLLSDVSEAAEVGDKLQKELSLPFNLNGQEIFTTVSIGIAFNQTGQDFQPEDLIRDANIAMYRAKALDKARPEVFARIMHAQAVTRWQLETDLRQAIKRQEFQLYYQPIVSLETGKIAGFEALVRWQSPQGDFVSPKEFIPVAEETGLIIPLGQWILQEACRQMAFWHEQFPQNLPLKISVNLSTRQFSQPDLVEQIGRILREVGLDRHSLNLEITESIVMDDVEAALNLLSRLKALGLQLSIDDFGTGYSSLSYLHCFPIDTLKVDQSFVASMSESKKYAEIVRTIVMLGHNLGMNVIAEGIETETQMKALLTLQCEYGQGYFFSKPLPSKTATALLARKPTVVNVARFKTE